MPKNAPARTPPTDELGDAYVRASPRVRLTLGAIVLVLLLALGTTVVLAMLRSGETSSTMVELDGAAPAASVDPVQMYVHVSGAVREPGLYRLTADARVVDAIAAAAGFAEGADTGGVNLARPLSDGELLAVPLVGAAADSREGDPRGDGRVNLNAAGESDLDSLPRVGPAIAQRIIGWREANGRFTSVDDLLSIPGIGEKMLEGLRPLVTV